MTDEGTFKQRRSKVTPDDLEPVRAVPVTEGNEKFVNPIDRIREIQQIVDEENESEGTPPPRSNRPLLNDPDAPFQISGQRLPDAFKKALQNPQAAAEQAERAPQQFKERSEKAPQPFKERNVRPMPDRQAPNPMKSQSRGSEALEDVLSRLAEHNDWELKELPSKGRFYDDIPEVLHIRPMTGKEEQILATPRHVRKGTAIDMIFKNCIREPIDTSKLLSVDRTYLLIYLRGISYTPEYDVEVRCSECAHKFNTVIDLNLMNVEACPDDFGMEDLQGELPTSGLQYRYRLATGDDEKEVTRHREMLVKEYGDQAEDDTLLFRTALLLEQIEQVTNRNELSMLLTKLPINDVAHLRNVINDPPFGVDTEIGLLCPGCDASFKIDLPLEANFFFPRKKAQRTRQ